MATYDVTQKDEYIDEIRWCMDADYNLQYRNKQVHIAREGLGEMNNEGECLVATAAQAEGLIKALQKAIDLKWLGQ